jgi:hypothetical protein
MKTEFPKGTFQPINTLSFNLVAFKLSNYNRGATHSRKRWIADPRMWRLGSRPWRAA